MHRESLLATEHRNNLHCVCSVKNRIKITQNQAAARDPADVHHNRQEQLLLSLSKRCLRLFQVCYGRVCYFIDSFSK